jgi:ATP-binding cassette subfamily B multidrug efflux pump
MIRLYRFLKPYTAYIFFILILIFIQSMSTLYLPTLMSDIVDTGIVNGDTGYIMRYGVFMLFVALGGTACSIAAALLSSIVSMGLGQTLREKVFTRVESFSLNEFDKLGTATMITRTTNDITQIQQVTVMIFRMMVSAPIMCIGGLIMALSVDKGLTVVLFVAIPLLAIVIFIVAFKGLPLFKLMQVKLDKINLVLREGLTGMRVIRAFNRDDYQSKRFDEANYDLTQNAIKVNKLMAIMFPIIMLAMNLTTVAIVWFGAIRIDNGDMQVGSLMAFIQYAMQIMFSIVMLTIMFVMVPRAQASAVRVNEILDTEPDIVDTEELMDGSADLEKGYVEFKDVTFSYPEAEEPALRNLNFSVKPGEFTAIIGGTGSGKSTLINLIPRFYDIQSGSVMVDGVDVRNVSQKKLRSKIGFVPQKSVLFTGTVYDNIRYGNENATDDAVKRAAKTAQAFDFVSEMKDGFDSVMAQGGSNLSGGQKQRLSIARALVRKPEIYIFDDSFSALDFKTDAKLRAALRHETKDSTVIIIAQRVATVMDADRIIVLEEGTIAAIGTHKELMKTCDVYKEIVSSQLSEEESA